MEKIVRLDGHQAPNVNIQNLPPYEKMPYYVANPNFHYDHYSHLGMQSKMHYEQLHISQLSMNSL